MVVVETTAILAMMMADIHPPRPLAATTTEAVAEATTVIGNYLSMKTVVEVVGVVVAIKMTTAIVLGTIEMKVVAATMRRAALAVEAVLPISIAAVVTTTRHHHPLPPQVAETSPATELLGSSHCHHSRYPF